MFIKISSGAQQNGIIKASSEQQSNLKRWKKKMWKTWWKLDISVCFVFRSVQSDEETAGGVCLSSRAETVDQSGVSISHRAQ